MNKGLIAKIALDVANTIAAPYISDECLARFTFEFLSRIDAERGKEAVARVDVGDDGYFADILPDRDVKIGQLLYAAPQPAIPEGWLPDGDDQIPSCVCKAGHDKLKALGIDVDYYEISEAFRAMIAAAKEPRHD